MSTVIEPAAKNHKPKTSRKSNNHPENKVVIVESTPDTQPSARKPWHERMRGGLDWPVVLWLAFLHLGALAAPFFFTWKAVALVVALWWLTGGVGICLGYHRLLTHGSFRTPRWLYRVIAVCGTLAGEGSPLMWVATHRKHHAHSDEPDDPHSPRDGGLWSHIVWLFPNHGPQYKEELFQRWAPDMAKDPFMRMLDKTFLLWHWGLGFALFGVGYYFWDTYTAWSLVVYGVFVRLVFVLHGTWFVNSATHIWGYRNYTTTDDSRNLWWVAALTWGEGWHNNHHAFQRMARHGHRWWEIDLTYQTIRLLEKCVLASHVVHDVPARKKHAG